MFWPIQRKKTHKQMCKMRRGTRRRLFVESLESRRLLAGDVTVDLTGTTLTLTGDVDPNEVSITPGDNPGEYKITGVDTDIIGDSLITDPFDTLIVDLEGGSDTFTLQGINYSNKILINGAVTIRNDDGSNVNRLIHARVVGDLNVEKSSGASESKLEIRGSTVVGDVIVDNTVGGSGASITKIYEGSILQQDLTISNHAGRDILYVYGQQGTGAGATRTTIDGDVTVDNGDGDTRTVFGLSPGDAAPTDPDVFGDITITNGGGNDEIVLYETNVWGVVDIDNGDGSTDVTVELSHIGKGVDLGTGTSFELDNGEGRDVFTMIDSTVKDDLDIDNGTSSDTFGSQTEIKTVGSLVHTRIGDDLLLDSDDGYDTVTLSDSTVVDWVDIELYGGSSEITFLSAILGYDLDILADEGRDVVRIEDTDIDGDTDIDLGDGVDTLEVLAASHLRGQSSFEGGGNVDTFLRELGTDAAIIEFLVLENFENDTFTF